MRYKGYNQDYIETRIRLAMLAASDSQVERGKVWYKSAHNLCVDLADTFNVTLETFVGIVATLSPNNLWSRNITDAINVITWDGISRLSPSTYSSNLDKALDILERGVIIGTNVSGWKVEPFYHTLLRPDYGLPVIDTWMYILLFPYHNKLKLHLRVAEREYAIKAFHNVAYSYDLLVSQVQAIVWLYIKEATENKAAACFDNSNEIKEYAKARIQADVNSIPWVTT